MGYFIHFGAKTINYDYKHFKKFKVSPFYAKYLALKNRAVLRLLLYLVRLKKNYYHFKLKTNNFKKYKFGKLYRKKRWLFFRPT
jgi:hypothetical protein